MEQGIMVIWKHFYDPLQDYEQYTCNGSVDIRGNRASKRHTGNWRACYSILGKDTTLLYICMIINKLLDPPIQFINTCRGWILWRYGILRSWDKPGELHDQGAEAKQCRCSQQHRFLAGHVLPDSPSRSFLGRFISWKTPNNLGVPHDIYHGTQVLPLFLRFLFMVYSSFPCGCRECSYWHFQQSFQQAFV